MVDLLATDIMSSLEKGALTALKAIVIPRADLEGGGGGFRALVERFKLKKKTKKKQKNDETL